MLPAIIFVQNSCLTQLCDLRYFLLLCMAGYRLSWTVGWLRDDSSLFI